MKRTVNQTDPLPGVDRPTPQTPLSERLQFSPKLAAELVQFKGPEIFATLERARDEVFVQSFLLERSSWEFRKVVDTLRPQIARLKTTIERLKSDALAGFLIVDQLPIREDEPNRSTRLGALYEDILLLHEAIEFFLLPGLPEQPGSTEAPNPIDKLEQAFSGKTSGRNRNIAAEDFVCALAELLVIPQNKKIRWLLMSEIIEQACRQDWRIYHVFGHLRGPTFPDALRKIHERALENGRTHVGTESESSILRKSKNSPVKPSQEETGAPPKAEQKNSRCFGSESMSRAGNVNTGRGSGGENE